MKPILLRCRAQRYAWGKVGEGSLVYRYLGIRGDAAHSPDDAYAELWMGDHPSAPALTDDGRRIGDVPGCERIPYLFKVLSIAKPLSIQAHPNKSWAEQLRARDPTHYPDENHKPEIALFVTPALLLYGIRHLRQIVAVLRCVADLARILETEPALTEDELPGVFGRLLRLPPGDYLPLLARVRLGLDAIDPLMFTAAEIISGSFPNDPGILFPLFLGVLEGRPGEAIFIPAGVPHAYLCGDLFEAMALSDNVVRAGLTPKFVDIDTLLAIMPWTYQEPSWVRPVPVAPGSVRYAVSGVEEFELRVTDIEAGGSQELVWPVAAISIIAAGEFGGWGEGKVVLTPPGVVLGGQAGAAGARVVTCTQLIR